VETRTSSGVPAPAPHELRRERLLDVLHKHRQRALILLVAGAGFGKSTLAAAYARESGAAVAWLTLQQADRDTRRLFTRLASALEAGFGEPAVPELRRGLATGAEGFGLVRLLLADLAQAPAHFILVLDDFHTVEESAEVCNAVDALLRDLPESGQVVITTRDAPPLSITRLVIEEAIFAFGTEDLRFSPQETEDLRKLRPREGPLDKDHDQIEAARYQRAEGWVAGILLGGAPTQLNIGGGSLLGGYVDREILSRLTPVEQGWLETLSVFDTITPQIAERALGAGPWQARLIELTERCPFLTAGQNGSYHLHALVRELVLNRLRRSPDARASAAWSVARAVAEEASDVAAVVRACQELGQIEGAIELVYRKASDEVQTGHWLSVPVTLGLLPESVRASNADLCLIEARALIINGDRENARKAADAALAIGIRAEDVQVQIRALIELATATFASDMKMAEDFLTAADHLLKTSNDLPTDRRRMLQGSMLGVAGICATLRGDTNAAREAFENAEHQLRLVGPSRELAMVQQNFGSFCNRVGDYAKAKKVLSEAALHWRSVGDFNDLALNQVVLGDLHLRLGELDTAGAVLHEAQEVAGNVGARRIEAHATTSLGQWHRANGRLDAAVAAFDRGIELGESTDRELLAQALTYRAEVALLQEDVATARGLLARAHTESQRVGSNGVLALVDRAKGRMHLVEGGVAEAVDYFQASLRRAGDAWPPDERAATLYWLGTAYLAFGRAHEAGSSLEQSIALVDQNGYPTYLASPAAEDGNLLKYGRDLGLNPVLLAEVERLAGPRRPWTGVESRSPINVVARNELPRIEVQLFGSFVLHRDGQLVSSVSGKVDRLRELVALLILYPQGLPDDEIAERMFPDMRHERGLHNLHAAIYSLRKELGKAAVRFGAHTYQLNPQLELIADVRTFDAMLVKARVANGDALIRSLSTAIELYHGPLLADAAWAWVDPVRLSYRGRFVEAALQLADLVAATDSRRSDRLAEEVLEAAPETDLAYELLITNARKNRDVNAVRRLIKRYVRAAAQFEFPVRNRLLDDRDPPTRAIR
jgi:LuxR family maltose regulon positive regulatory protein